MLKKFFYKFHRTLGTVFSILFVLWFFTGFVMIYHNFPKISDQQKFSGLYPLYYDLQNYTHPSILNADSLEYLAVKAKSTGYFDFEYQQGKQYCIVTGDDSVSHRQSFNNIYAYASNVNSAPIIRVDTLQNLDRWIPYRQSMEDYPVYKFYYDDEKKTELYVSSQTGEGLQYTNSESRFWAWIGAIPHWLYIANLRHYTDAWRTVVIVLSGIGSLVCVTGIVLGFRAFHKRNKRNKTFKSPYKSIYKWHHVLGFIFGLFVFTFAFSGMMSLQKIPQWLIKTKNADLETSFKENLLAMRPSAFPLDYSELIKAYNGDIQKIEWATFGTKPYYKAVIDDSLYYFDASVSNKIQKLYLDEEDIKNKLNKIHITSAYKIELIHDYDNYYIHKRYKYPLPVYKVTVDNADKSLYYIDPKTGDTRYFNTNTRFRKWTYQALHSFSIKYILDRPILWNFLMWTSMIGGTLVSLTGLWLAIRYIKRKIKKKRKHTHNSQNKK